MSMPDGDDSKREIIIVKRRGGDEDEGHHGGVWKIAFADFMTAMMCFFLVMWLVNATTEETKAAVASYFNPMRLADPTPSTQQQERPSGGSSESVEGRAGWESDNPSGDSSAMAGPAQQGSAPGQHDQSETSDAHLFADPFAVLAEIAQQTATMQNISARGDGGAQTSGPATGAHGGESYRDPFAPDFWSEQVAIPPLPDAEPLVLEEPAPPVSQAPAMVEVPAVEELEGEEVAALAAPLPDAAQAILPDPAESLSSEENAPQDSAAEQMAESLRSDLAEAFGEDSQLNESITITSVDKGILISLTDDLEYGMFQVGSAVPVGQLVLAMEKVGAALDQRVGKVSVMGHTDGRPFRSAEYDNWRLSTARAHAAYYMLVRGGLDETRIGEVAGYADRQLKNASDPLDGINRRIEILLEVEG
ncbi:MAG: MotB family protein [Aliihoeflea sp.]